MIGPCRVPILGFVAAALAACESPLSPAELRALAQAEAQWTARSFQDYVIEVRQACFCPPEVTQWARVEVIAGAVNRVVLLDSGAEVPSDQRGRFPTVEQIFNYIRSARDDDWLKDVVVEFDREFGFPTYVSFVPKPAILDAGGAYYVRHAGPVS